MSPDTGVTVWGNSLPVSSDNAISSDNAALIDRVTQELKLEVSKILSESQGNESYKDSLKRILDDTCQRYNTLSAPSTIEVGEVKIINVLWKDIHKNWLKRFYAAIVSTGLTLFKCRRERLSDTRKPWLKLFLFAETPIAFYVESSDGSFAYSEDQAHGFEEDIGLTRREQFKYVFHVPYRGTEIDVFVMPIRPISCVEIKGVISRDGFEKQEEVL